MADYYRAGEAVFPVTPASKSPLTETHSALTAANELVREVHVILDRLFGAIPRPVEEKSDALSTSGELPALATSARETEVKIREVIARISHAHEVLG